VAALARLDDNGESIPEAARVSKRVLAVSTLLMLMLLGGMYVVGRRTAPAQAAEKSAVSVLIADFENRTGNHTFEDSIEQALALSMEGASFLTAYSRDDVKTLANRLPPGSTLTELMAQAISTREGIKYVLAGSVETAGSRIRLAI